VLPVLEGEMDIIAEFVDYLLGGSGLADDLYLLGLQVVDAVFYALHLFLVLLLLVLGVETDQSLKNLFSGEGSCLLLDLLLEFEDVILNFSIVFLHRIVIAGNRFGDFLLEIGEEPLDDGNHLALGFQNAFLDVFLLLAALGLMVLDV
jgi:hypothetical protein